jgi:hypothetical protein
MAQTQRSQLLFFGFFLLSTLLICSSTLGAESGKLDSMRVEFEADNLPLRDALLNLATAANLQIVFNDADMADVRASCNCRGTTLRSALEALLQSTPLTFEMMTDGQIVIVRRKINLKGYVKAADSGETLPYANVMIKGTQKGTASNVSGYFVLVNAPAGLCTLRVSYIGYEPVEMPLTLTDGKDMVFVQIKPQVLPGTTVAVTADNLQTVEVAAEPSQLRLAPLQISRLPSVGELDVFRSLQLLPGIGGVSDLSTGLYVRGGTPDQNLVLFDGMTIYHLDHFFGFNSAFNTDAIKDVRVFKGGFPAKFGGRISSIVELTGKTGSYDNLQAGANLNLLSGSGMLQLPIAGRAAWLLSFRRSYTDIIRSGLYNDIYDFITRPPRPSSSGNGQRIAIAPDFYYYDLVSKFSYSFSGRNALSLSFYNSEDNLDQSQNLRGTNPGLGSSPTEDVTEWGNIGVSGKWSRLWSDRLYSTFTAAYSLYSSESRGALEITGGNQNRTAVTEINDVEDLSLQWQNEWHASANHKLEFGVQFNQTNVRVNFTADDTLQYLQRDDDATHTALYFQDAWKPITPVELTLGLRAIRYAPTRAEYIEPRAAIKFAINNHLSLKGAYGEYHQFVNRITNDNALNGNRDFWLLADERLAPNFAEHKIIGLSYETRGYLFDVEAYHKNLAGVAEFSQRFRRPPESTPEALFSIGDGVAKGIEFLAQKKTGKLNGWASYTLSKVDYQIPSLNGGAAFPANHDRPHEIKLVGNYVLGKWNFAATWVLASGTPFTAPSVSGTNQPFAKNAHRLPAYHRLDIGGSRQFSFANLDWEIGLSIFNLYDRSNVLRREFDINNNTFTVRDITALGFTPSFTLKVDLK